MSVKQIFNTSAELDYPTVLPTLDLDFANSKALDPRITFTRSSGGSYTGADGLIKLAGVNEARFDHDPYTGESLGLLVEEARTNLFTYSEDISIWGLAAATRTLDVGIAPNGTLTADRVETTGGGVFRSGLSVANATPCTYSVFLKHVSGTGIAVQIGFERFGSTVLAGQSSFNLLTGVIVSNGAAVTASTITAFQNGWYRVSVTATSTDVTATTINYSTITGNQFLIWGAQLEAGAFPTSYIPTVASTRTRAVDNASITGKNFSEWYRQDEWTLMIGARRNYAGNFRAFPNLARINDGTGNNTIAFYGADASIQFTNFGVTSGGVSYTPYVAAVIPTTAPFKMIQSLKRNRSIFGADGVMTATGTSVEMLVGANQLLIGVGNWGGTINRLTYFPKALSSSNLQALTS